MSAAAGSWQQTSSGLRPAATDETAGHVVLARPVPSGLGLRVTLEATAATTDPGEISVFLGSRQQWNDGYTFQLGAYNNSCSMLHRDGVLLWVGPGRVRPGARHQITLERVGDRVRVIVDGVEQVSLSDLLPLDGPYAELYSYLVGEPEPGSVTPTMHTFTVEQALLPDLVPADRLLVQLGMAAEQARGSRRRALAEEAVRVADDL